MRANIAQKNTQLKVASLSWTYVILRIVESLHYWQFCSFSNQVLSPKKNLTKGSMKNPDLAIADGRHLGSPESVNLTVTQERRK